MNDRQFAGHFFDHHLAHGHATDLYQLPSSFNRANHRTSDISEPGPRDAVRCPYGGLPSAGRQSNSAGSHGEGGRLGRLPLENQPQAALSLAGSVTQGFSPDRRPSGNGPVCLAAGRCPCRAHTVSRQTQIDRSQLAYTKRNFGGTLGTESTSAAPETTDRLVNWKVSALISSTLRLRLSAIS